MGGDCLILQPIQKGDTRMAVNQRSTPPAYPKDEELTHLFFQRSENALSETDRKYGKLFRTIAEGITESREDAEECVNDAYLRLWNSIPPECPLDLRAYGAKIVRNLSLNRIEYNRAEKRGGSVLLTELDETIPDGDGTETDSAELTALLDRFLSRQSREKRAAFILRYWNGMSLSDIAERLGCTESKVKSELFRIRTKLREELEKEGIQL